MARPKKTRKIDPSFFNVEPIAMPEELQADIDRNSKPEFDPELDNVHSEHYWLEKEAALAAFVCELRSANDLESVRKIAFDKVVSLYQRLEEIECATGVMICHQIKN